MTARAFITLLLALGALALVAAPAPPAAAAQAGESEIRTYIVQPGDSVWSIAEQFYGSGREYRIIYRYNQFIGRPPFLLRPGQVLRLPVGRVLPEARLNWLKRRVRAQPPRSLDWLPAQENMNLWRQYKVETGDDSAAHIVFEDESDLRLRENALLVIYGGSARRTRTERQEKTRVVLEHGTIRGGLASLDGDPEPMEVETPSGVVELLATMAQVQAAAERSALSVYEGRATLTAEGAKVEVPEGFGAVVERGQPPRPPRRLPAVPGWRLDGGTAVALVPTGRAASFGAAWEPVDEAAFYRVELAEDAAFQRTLVDVTIDADIQQAVRLEDIAPGAWFARVAALDADGLEGHPSEPLAVRVVEVRSARHLEPGDAPGRWQVAAFTRLSLAPSDAAAIEWRAGGGPFRPGDEALDLTRPGEVLVEARLRGGAGEGTPFTVRVLGVRAELEPPEEQLEVGGPMRELVVRLRDDLDRPTSVPGLTLRADPGGELPLAPIGPGRFSTFVPAPGPGPAVVTVVAAWPGGALAAGELGVIQPAWAGPRPLPPYHWETAIGSSPWDRRTVATPTPSLAPIDRAGLHTRLMAGAGPDTLGLAFVGELGLAERRLGLDAELTLLRPRLGGDHTQSATVGDLVVGARYIALEGAVVSLAPSLRLRAPLAKREDEGGRLLGVEPGLLARLSFSESLRLEVRQALFAATDFGEDATHLSWVGNGALVWRAAEWLSVQVDVEHATSLMRPGDLDAFTAVSAGGGLLLHVERFRIGLLARGGLNAAARRELGDFAGVLAIDVAFGRAETEQP